MAFTFLIEFLEHREVTCHLKSNTSSQELDPWKLVEGLFFMILSHPNRKLNKKQVSGQDQLGLQGDVGGEKFPSRETLSRSLHQPVGN